jgi:hypothetical protein
LPPTLALSFFASLTRKIMPFALYLLLLLTLMRYRPTGDEPSPGEGVYALAPASYVVLAQKALTYQADFQLEAWGELLAKDVEYHVLDSDSSHPLVGRTAVLAYWQNWKSSGAVQEVRRSEFYIIPIRSPNTLPIYHLSGIYVSVTFRQRVTYLSGQVRGRLVCLWLHFNRQKLIDGIYGLETKGS